MSWLEWLGRLLGRGRGRRPAIRLAGLDPARTRLIVGLGNPGPEYLETRHNVGFRCVEALARRQAASWQDQVSRWHSLIAVVRLDSELTVALAKPQTFMNRSGLAVKALVDYLAIDPRQCLVVYDDMDLPFGTLRLRERGSAGTHNGMRSVVSNLGTEAVARLRIGISQASPGEAVSHVLSEFSADEREPVEALVNHAADAALAWAIDGAAAAMNRYNSLRQA